MYPHKNATPRAILLGIKDKSGRRIPTDPERLPTHLPHLYIYAEKGPTMPRIVRWRAALNTYGVETFKMRGKYSTHQSVLARLLLEANNKVLIQRLRPLDADPPAGLRISAEILPNKIEQFARDENGYFILNNRGLKVSLDEYLDGYTIRWLVEPLLPFDEYDDQRLLENRDNRLLENRYNERALEFPVGTARVREGNLVNSEGVRSTIYPIIDFEVAHFGDYGRSLGFKFSTPHSLLPIDPMDPEVVDNSNAFIYRMEFVRREVGTSTPITIPNLNGQLFTDFSFKEDAIDSRTGVDYYMGQALLPVYTQEDPSGENEVIPPFGNIHVYYENFENILAAVQSNEWFQGLVDRSPSAMHRLNIFTGYNEYRVPYYTLEVLGPEDGGAQFNHNNVFYAMGGYDGTMTNQTFDEQVRHEMNHYGFLEAKLLDSAQYPVSVYYDTGFSILTKRALMRPIGLRKDVYVVLSTHEVGRRPNNENEETSIAVGLRVYARMYPESEVYGTSTCRAIIFGQCGDLIAQDGFGKAFPDRLPLTIEFALKCAAYMGSDSGVWREGLAYDMPPNNHVRMFKNVSNTYKVHRVRSNDWDAGLSWVQHYDRRNLFFPGIQTVYDDDTSVLNSAANMIIAVELQKVAERTWRDLTGISSLTPDQFLERSDNLIESKTIGRFDERVTIVPETFFTENDAIRGYSWSCNIHMYAQNMRTVGVFTIVAHRGNDT